MGLDVNVKGVRYSEGWLILTRFWYLAGISIFCVYALAVLGIWLKSSALWFLARYSQLFAYQGFQPTFENPYRSQECSRVPQFHFCLQNSQSSSTERDELLNRFFRFDFMCPEPKPGEEALYCLALLHHFPRCNIFTKNFFLIYHKVVKWSLVAS